MRNNIIELELRVQRQQEIIDDLKRKMQSSNQRAISVHSDEVHDEDAILITFKNLKELMQVHNKCTKCQFCNNEVREVVLRSQNRAGYT